MARLEPSNRAQRRQTRIGLALACAILTSWIAVHVYGVYMFQWSLPGLLTAPAIVGLQTWLSVGLFIVAHDAMHGSLAPSRPGLGRLVGRLSLLIYAGFGFSTLRTSHHAHHAEPGGAGDPDFHPPEPRRFWPWFVKFMRTHFGWRQIAFITLAALVAVTQFHARTVNLIVFWAVPALLSAVQLFLFGTYLPHRHEATPFVDAHNARSSRYPAWLSLLTCFHFGHHHEHHLHPHIPWWRLHRV